MRPRCLTANAIPRSNGRSLAEMAWSESAEHEAEHRAEIEAWLDRVEGRPARYFRADAQKFGAAIIHVRSPCRVAEASSAAAAMEQADPSPVSHVSKGEET